MRVARLEQAALLLQPFLFAAGGLLSRFMALTTSPDSLIRPMVVTLALTAVCLVVVGLASRNWAWASMMTSGLVLFTLRDQIFALLFAVCAWWVLIRIARRASGRQPPNMHVIRSAARATGIFSVAFFAVMGWSAWTAVEQSVPDLDFPVLHPRRRRRPEHLPHSARWLPPPGHTARHLRDRQCRLQRRATASRFRHCSRR